MNDWIEIINTDTIHIAATKIGLFYICIFGLGFVLTMAIVSLFKSSRH